MLHVAMRGMRIWPQYATKCCKNAGNFFPDEWAEIFIEYYFEVKYIKGINNAKVNALSRKV